MIKQLVMAITAVIIMIFCTRIVRGKAIEKSVMLIMWLFYCICLVYFTMFRGARTGLGWVSMKLPMPFWRAIKAHRYGISTNRSVLNVLLFVPFGYLLPHMISWKDGWKAKWWVVVIAGFIFSLIIEISQLVFRFGVFELDDLVKNTMGAAVGWLVWYLLNRRNKCSAKSDITGSSIHD